MSYINKTHGPTLSLLLRSSTVTGGGYANREGLHLLTTCAPRRGARAGAAGSDTALRAALLPPPGRQPLSDLRSSFALIPWRTSTGASLAEGTARARPADCLDQLFVQAHVYREILSLLLILIVMKHSFENVGLQ